MCLPFPSGDFSISAGIWVTRHGAGWWQTTCALSPALPGTARGGGSACDFLGRNTTLDDLEGALTQAGSLSGAV